MADNDLWKKFKLISEMPPAMGSMLKSHSGYILTGHPAFASNESQQMNSQGHEGELASSFSMYE